MGLSGNMWHGLDNNKCLIILNTNDNTLEDAKINWSIIIQYITPASVLSAVMSIIMQHRRKICLEMFHSIAVHYNCVCSTTRLWDRYIISSYERNNKTNCSTAWTIIWKGRSMIEVYLNVDKLLKTLISIWIWITSNNLYEG